MKKGFVFSLIAITITTILLSFSLFYFNTNENEKAQNLNIQEIRKVNFVLDDISNNINSFLGYSIFFESNKINFVFNLNNQPNFSKLLDLQTFYNTTFNSLTSGDLNLNLSNIAAGKTNINFNDNNFEFDYNNTIVKIIPNDDLNYYIKIRVDSSSTSKTNWTFGGSGIYVTLDYSDNNYSYNNSGYINPAQACNTNKFTINYNSDKLTIDICNFNSINGTLVIDDNIISLYNIDTNIIAYDSTEINNPYYNADLNYILGKTSFIGKVPIN